MKHFMIVAVASMFLVQIPFTLTAGESCYDLGYRYGLCSGKSLLGRECKPENDFTIPFKCRTNTNTQEGIRAGVMAAKSGENTFRISPSGKITRNKPPPSRADESNHEVGMERVNAIISRMEKYKSAQESN